MVPQAFEVNVIQMENPACATCELIVLFLFELLLVGLIVYVYTTLDYGSVITDCWVGLGGAELAQTPTMQQIVVSRAE